jgi:hypothetical protein
MPGNRDTVLGRDRPTGVSTFQTFQLWRPGLCKVRIGLDTTHTIDPYATGKAVSNSHRDQLSRTADRSACVPLSQGPYGLPERKASMSVGISYTGRPQKESAGSGAYTR